MANLSDDQFMSVKETTYNTPVAVSRSLVVLDGTTMKDWDLRPEQGLGMSVGGYADLDSRYLFQTVPQGSGMLKFPMQSKGLGTILELAHGVATQTVVAGALNQQNFTPNIAGTVLPSHTMQLAVPQNDGTMRPVTYSGCSVKAFTIECVEDDWVTLACDIDARSETEATALGTFTVPTGFSLFHHAQGVTTFSTTALTVPTTTTLATGGGAAVTFVRSWSLDVDNNLDIGRRIIGGRNQPTRGRVVGKFKAKVEYNDQSLVTAWKAGTGFSFSSTVTTTEVIAGGNAVLQVAIPRMRITSPLPDPAAGKTVMIDLEADLKLDGTNQLFYTVLRTADTTL